MDSPVQVALKFFEAQKLERDPWDVLYQEVADYMLPRRAAFTTKLVKGSNKFDYLHDDTGPWALEQFANGLHSMLVSPLSKWFTLQIKDRELREDPDVRAWRDEVEEIMYDQFNSPSSSFHPMVQESFTDVGAFGYAVAYSEWSEEDKAVRFQARFPGECYLIEDQYGRVHGLVRKYTLKIDQFVQQFGIDKLPPEEKRKYEETGQGQEYSIVHVVMPRTHPIMQRFSGIAAVNKYGSVYVCEKMKDAPLRVGGFRSFPVHVARWGKRTGEIYSTSPGITALPSVRRANAIQLDLIKIAHAQADPPTQGPDDEALSPYDMSPGAQNYYRAGSTDRIEVIQSTIDPTWAVRMLDGISQGIIRAFFVDAFLTTADSNGQNVKATFVMQRRDERFRQLAAMLSRIEREYLGSLIGRTFDLCDQADILPPPPYEGVTLDVEYLSPITRAQRSEHVDSLYSLIELSAVGAQYDPTVMQGFNWSQIQTDVGSKVYSLPSAWFFTPDQVRERQQAEAEMQQQMQGVEQARGLAGAIKDVAQADLAQRS